MTIKSCSNCNNCGGFPCAGVMELAGFICSEAAGTMHTVVSVDGKQGQSVFLEGNSDQLVQMIANVRRTFEKLQFSRFAKLDVLYDTAAGEKRVTVLHILKSKLHFVMRDGVQI